MSNNRGSEWRKWDLHVHTPYSYLNNNFGDNFDNYVKKLLKKAIENQIAVIGITDYFCIEGYKKIKNEYLLSPEKLNSLFTQEEIEEIKKIKILPNIEFRLNKIIGTNRVNFHVIFSEDVTEKDIEENFLHDLEFIYEGNPQGTDEKWKLKLSNIEELGKKLISQQPELGDNNMFVGMKCAVVDDNQILDILNSKQSKFKDKYLIITPPDEDLSDINWKSQDHLVRKVIIQKTDLLFASNPKTIKWGLGEFNSTTKEFIDEFKSIKPTVWGSDAHDFNKLFKPFNNRYTWIKANSTFEGLKQVIYEPKHRVAIQKHKPNEALHKLEEIRLSFDDTVKWGNDKFCFAGLSEPITLSLHLTCIIGGRGSGKSTFLNLVAEKIGKEETDFFKDLKINTPDYIKFEPEFVENIEFLAQNTIESFATDSQKFTQAIFERIDKNPNGKLSNIENDINHGLEIYDEQIIRLKNRDDIDKKLKEQDEDLIKYQNIVKAFTDKVYIDNKDKLQEVQKKIIEIENSREKYKDLFLKIKDIHSLDKMAKKNNYDEYFNNLLDDLNALYNSCYATKAEFKLSSS